MIELAAVDRALLAGEHGAAASRAMDILVRYATSAGASEFISISSAHIDACLYHGPSSLEFVRRFADLGGRVSVPTTLNVAAVDVTHPEWHCGPPGLVAAQLELTELYEQLGCIPTLTCAPYQRLHRPVFGEHVAWAESNAIVFVNSVLGARTDRYGDFADVCAALTGRVPNVGLHREENRRARCVILVTGIDEMELPRDLYFAGAGYVVGSRAGELVPLILGLPHDATEDELKSFGASAASSGSLALFHAEGLTPEAKLQSPDLPEISIVAETIHDAVTGLCPLEAGEKVAAVCVGTPHYSIEEFKRLNEAVRGRSRHADVSLFVSTSREIAEQVGRDERFADIRAFGARIVVDTCTYVAPVVAGSGGAILTTSAKFAHYAPGNLQRRTGLMTLERCIRSAELGRVAP